MPEGRPEIPAQMKRDLLEEVGHRCAIPTCKSTEALQFAHIDQWAKVQDHTFDNIIVLCANDHFRYDNKKISRQSMLAYKRNLATLNGRYSDFEQRLLRLLTQLPTVLLEGGNVLLINTMNLEDDGLVETVQTRGNISITNALMDDQGNRMGLWSTPHPVQYSLSDRGNEFVDKWFNAQELE
ncbi:HNH endonuclease signature motif containing protein [Arthrobacter sp. PAMC 25486]|uniref:HNH endonuclease signature motif containing protein n=1 Tax=Arthrobacter sp. PAMC 25486 TaxID=1494608 RepID=UPI0012FE8EA2|nr:HNH endonuclease signature motif containing protein [Arthrobacter sp. PAMC 25486]